MIDFDGAISLLIAVGESGQTKRGEILVSCKALLISSACRRRKWPKH